MFSRDWSNSVATRLLACDPAVSVVVIQAKRVTACTAFPPACSVWLRCRMAQGRRHFGTLALPEYPLQRVGLAPVDGKSVCLPHRQNPTRKPASISIRKPFGRVLAALLSPVYIRRSQREIPDIGRKTGPRCAIARAEPRVMRLAGCDHVLDVRLPGRCEARPGIGAVHGAETMHDLLLNGGRIPVVSSAVIGRATMFWQDIEAAPGFGRDPDREDDRHKQYRPDCFQTVT